MKHSVQTIAILLLLPLASLLNGQAPAPNGATPGKTTEVMVQLKVKPGIERDQLMKVMPEEVRATVRLYLEGKIQQWYSRSDGTGVMFIMNATNTGEARAVAETLPLAKAKLVEYEYTELGPLAPLAALLGPPAGK
jgi:hypothetical protein